MSRRRKHEPRAAPEAERRGAAPVAGRRGAASEPGRPSGAPEAGRRRAAARRLRLWAPVAAVVVVGAAALLAYRAARFATPRRAPGPAVPVADPLDALAPGAAYDSALALATRGRTLECLPFYQRALRGVRQDFWQLHCNYSSALYNLTLQLRRRRGIDLPETRSSLERAALLREAIRESGIARALAATPHERAIVIGLLGQLAHVYGFPWEAFIAYRQAQFADPSDPALAARANRFQWSLEHPTAPGAAPPDTTARIER